MSVKEEPVVAASGLVSAVFALLIAFGVHVSDGFQQSVLAVVGVVFPLVVGFFVRKKVTPTSKLR